jgi:glycosyltransferase involved in cell wall biosynthesis
VSVELSVIIPTHNSSEIIDRVLAAVFQNEGVQKEVIVVDDASTDNTLKIVRRYPCKVIPLREKAGPGGARNIGAREAQGPILMFMDADALLEKETLRKILRRFREAPELACVSGVFEKNSEDSGWFAKYRDLQLHYWHQSSPSTASVFVLTVGAIRRDIFFEVGGFSVAYGESADIEDFEIGHRISGRYPMFIDKTIRFRHLEHASPFPVLVRKLFRRARMWTRLFLKRKRFEKNYATRNRGVAILCAASVPVAAVLSLRWPFLAPVGGLSLAAFFILDLGFYRFLYREGTLLFLVYASCVHYFLSLVLFSGALAGGAQALWKIVAGLQESGAERDELTPGSGTDLT